MGIKNPTIRRRHLAPASLLSGQFIIFLRLYRLWVFSESFKNKSRSMRTYCISAETLLHYTRNISQVEYLLLAVIGGYYEPRKIVVYTKCLIDSSTIFNLFVLMAMFDEALSNIRWRHTKVISILCSLLCWTLFKHHVHAPYINV